ncbi:MAG TPA: type II toxin-antitoxin system RelE/ParE family toxin [Tepidisphaeraceae bacterium]|nr:type II toxin-antitoxin system RelE/ParE family toxin [Tepidisphaeraceae bacterium]
MYEIRVTAEARTGFLSLPASIQPRVQQVFERLIRWPSISGAKPLKRELKGAYRIRTGDWRVLFTVDPASQRITVFRIDNRRDVYE